MKLGRSLLLACLGLAACGELSGTITLQRAMNVVDKKGKTQQLANGTYRAEFEYKEDKREIKLKVKDAIQGKKDLEMKIIVPATTEIPRNNGSVVLKGNEIGQPFDLHGELNTDVSETSPTRGVESCTYTEREYVCRRVCEERIGRDGKKYTDCHRACDYEYVTKYGQKDVEYHYVTTTVSLMADLLETQSQENVGKLNVDRTDSRQVYDYVGPCLR